MFIFCMKFDDYFCLISVVTAMIEALNKLRGPMKEMTEEL